MSGSWIRKERRFRIYFRDQMRCGWCNCLIVNNDDLTIDHCIPTSKGGSHRTTNLITCCKQCNSRRGNMSISGFAKIIASEKGENKEKIISRIKRMRRKKLPRIN